MRIDASDAIEEFVANCFSGNDCSGGENLFDNRSVSHRRFLFGKPIGVAAACAAAGDVIHVLDDNGQARQRSRRRTAQRRSKIVRDEKRTVHVAASLS